MPQRARYYTIKEVQKKLNLSYESAYRHLSDLIEKGHIIAVSHENKLYYRLNLSNPETITTIKFLDTLNSNKKENQNVFKIFSLNINRPFFLFFIVISTILLIGAAIYLVDVSSKDSLITGYAIRGPIQENSIENMPTIIQEPNAVQEEQSGEISISEEPVEHMPTIIQEPAPPSNATLFEINPAIIDANGNIISANIQFKNKKDNSLISAFSESEYRLSKGKLRLQEDTYDVNITLNEIPIKQIKIKEFIVNENITTFIKVDDAPETGNSVQTYAIDPTAINFSSAEVTAIATGDTLFKCKEWNFESQTCEGEWVIIKSITPGQEYTFTLTPEDPGFMEVILITKAAHLNSNRTFISDIYNEVKEQDEIWSAVIPVNDYIRATFEKPLDNTNDITIYARSNGSSVIEIYAENSDELIATIDNISEAKFYKTYLTELKGQNSVFDLKVVGDMVEIDQIIDPSQYYYFYNESEAMSSTTSITFVNKTILTFTIPEARNYTIIAEANMNSSDTTYQIETQLLVDATTQAVYISNPDEAAIHSDSFMTFKIMELGAGTHTIILQYRTANAAQTVSIDDARIIAIETKNFYFNETEAEKSLTTTYANITTLNVSVASADNYLILAYAAYKPNSTADSVYANAILDGTSLGESLMEGQGATDYRPYMTFNVSNLSIGSHSLYIQGRSELGTMYIRRARIAAIPITGNFNTSNINVSEAETTNSATSPANKTVLSFTPSSSGDYLMLATCILGGDATDGAAYNAFFDAQIDGTSYGDVQYGMKDDTDRMTMFTMKKLTLSAAAHTTNVRYWSGASASPDTSLKNTRVIMLRLLTNQQPTTPTNITCNGGSCNNSFGQSITVNCSGSTDADNDTITYVIDAALLNNTTVQNTTDFQYLNNTQNYTNVSTTCSDSVVAAANYEFYSLWTIPGSGNVTLTALNFWQGDTSLSTTEQVRMALYLNNTTSNLISEIVTINGTGASAWTGKNLTTPITIELGKVYWVGIESTATYNMARDESANCATYLPNAVTLYITPVSGGLDSTVPVGSNSANHLIIPGITYVPQNQNTDWKTYNDIDSNYSNIVQIDVKVEIDSYNPAASVNFSTTKPDIQLEVYNSTHWVAIGNFSLSTSYTGSALNTTNANFTLSTINSAILTAWKDSSNQDIRIRGINMDYYNATIFDEINTTNIWVSINGRAWSTIGNHTNGSTYGWDISAIQSQTDVSLRCKAIDINGSNTYSAYYSPTMNMTLDSVPPTVNFVNPTPTNNTNQSQDWVYVNATITDDKTAVSACLLEWNGVNESMTRVGTGTSVYCYINKTSLSSNTYTYKVHANDSGNNWGVSQLQKVTVDVTPPTYSNDADDSSGSIVEGGIVNISLYWQDTGLGLDTAIFRTNITGSWVNTSTCTFNNASTGWCNKTIDTTGYAGNYTCWNQYANDSLGNMNSTMSQTVHCFNVTSANTAPSTTTPTIDPATAHTGDDLSCNATLTDAEQTSLTAYWTWYKNDVVNLSGTKTSITNGSNVNITVLGNGNTTKGESWICGVIPNDGVTNGTAVNSTAKVIQNSIPTIGTPTLNNTTPYTNDVLKCDNGSFTDIDGDSATWYYGWYDTGVLIAGQSSSTLDLSTSGLDKGDNITCSTIAYDGEVNATAWQNSSNYAIIQNTAPNITSVDITPNTAYTNDDLTCAVSGWSDADGDTAQYYYEWYNGTTLTFTSLSSSTTNVFGNGNTTKGETWNCTVKPYDGTANGTAFSDAVTIQNIVPTTPTSVTIAPPTVYTDTTVTCTASGSSDTDNDTITYYYKFNDTSGTLQNWATTNTFDCNTAGCDKADTLYCHALASTNDANSSANYNNTTVLNSPPIASTVYIKPLSPTTFDNLTCNYTYSDADIDSESGTSFRWFKNDALQSITTNLVTSGNLSNGDSWICQIIPNDGTVNGTAVNSTVVEIGSAAPAIVLITDNSNSTNPTNVGNNIIFTVNWSDPDAGQNESTYVCNTSNISSSGCADATFCSVINSTANPQICNYTSQQSDNTTVTYYVKVCDESNKCSGASGPYTFDINHAPNLTTAPDITPTTAYTNTVFTCNNGNFSDQDSDVPGNNTYKWFNSGLLVSGQNTTTFDCNAVSGCDKGSIIICEETPVDQHNFAGTPRNSSGITVLNSQPSITVTEPDGIGDVVTNSYTVTWTVTDNDTDTITVNCYADNDAAGFDISYTCFTGTSNDGSEICSTSLWTTSDYYIWCNATDGTGYGTDYSSGALTVDHTGPAIGTPVATPSIINQTQTTNITVNITDNVNVSTVLIEITYPNGTAFNYTMTQGTGNAWNYSFNNTLQPGTYNYTIYSNDTQNNWNSNGIFTFIVNDVTAPAVTDVNTSPNPANQSQTIIISTNVTDYYWNSINTVITDITYDSASTTVTLTSNGTHYVGTFTNTTWVGQYNVTIIANDTSGNVNNTETTNFTINDVTPPSIMLTIPINGSTLSSGTTSKNITATTNETAECRYGNVNDAWANMTELNNTNSTSHNFTATGLTNGGTYTYYFLCQDVYSNLMSSAYMLKFSIATPSVQPPEGGVGGGLPPNVTTNVTPPTNVTIPGDVKLSEQINETTGTSTNTSVRDSVNVDMLEGTTLEYIITNTFNKTLANVTLTAEFPNVDETPQPISYPNRIGWDLEWLTGWVLVSDVLEPRLMQWELASFGIIDKLEPSENINAPILINTPLTKLESGEMVLNVYSNNVKLFNKTVLLNITKKPIIVAGDHHNDTQTSDIYISLNSKELANSTDIMIEFDLNDGKNTIIYDYFGPYNADIQGKLIIAQRYHFNNQIGGKVYDMHIRVYKGLTQIDESYGKLDLTNKTVTQQQSLLDGLFNLFK